MLPNILSEQVLNSLKNFISTGFETQTPLFKGMFTRFTEEHNKFYKGAYLSIDLPFLQGGTKDKNYFSTLKTDFPPYFHQEQAWQRISSNKQAQSTIVATGTGSGKTECFLYPVLDHCVRSDKKGIKAIIIYPMNALATDQSKRFAKVINSSPNLKGKVRVGLFVGGDDSGSTIKSMMPEKVITDKYTIRSNPPDILLTNYKMLDFLLMRPKDQKLWQHNSEETLKYLIVDELHTFDGAQGTDLSCLIRRMKDRLQTPKEHLICVGTSATLGDDSSVQGLTEFAGKIFQDNFDAESVIGEARETSSDFIGNQPIKYGFFVTEGFSEIINPDNYDSEETYLQAQFQLLFQGEPVEDIDDPEWRKELGEKLKQHQFFYNLLQLLTEPAFPMHRLVDEYQKLLPDGICRRDIENLINSVCALTSWARSPKNPELPLVNLRVQLWVRELRRMVAPIKQLKPVSESSDAEVENHSPIALSFSDDLKQSTDDIYLPVVQCTKCHATAWAGVKPKEQNTLKTDLRLVYNAFFGNSPELITLFPIDNDFKEPDSITGFKSYLCGCCGALQSSEGVCASCGEESQTYVYQPNFIKERTIKGTPRLVTEHHCPVCLSQHSMMVFGARSASLSSVAIHQSYATPYNDDKKLITFSDNVQDAAHRAGFFAARTWQHNVRMAIAQAIPENDDIGLIEFYQHVSNFWLDTKLNTRALDDIRFISEFIAPNMLYYPEYINLTEQGISPKGTRLIPDIKKRFEWEVLAEFGYRGAIGRSLQRTGTATLGIKLEPVKNSAELLQGQLAEELGLQHLEYEIVLHFILGLLMYMKQRGAIYHEFLEGYIQNSGKTFILNKIPFLPNFSEFSNGPSFICNKNSHPEFDCLINKKGKSWYQNWCAKTLLATEKIELVGGSFSESIEAEIFTIVIKTLVSNGLLMEFESAGAQVWALNPKQLYISRKLINLTTDQQPFFYIPNKMINAVDGMPSLIINDHALLSQTDTKPHWLKQLYTKGEIHRVIAHEHTGLLGRKKREEIEDSFMQGTHPWSLNLLSATPTLEMGIDIGDLSSVLLCSVPPSQANYLQRIGRAGRLDGNAFNFTVAQGKPHDLHFYADPKEMMTGSVEAPDIYLNASAVIKRQLTAFCFDNWVATGINDSAIPTRMNQVLNVVERADTKAFPYTFLTFVRQNADDLFERFLGLFEEQLNTHSQNELNKFLLGGAEGSSLSQGFENNLIQFLFEIVKERKSLKDKIEQLRKYLKKLEKKPMDEAIVAEIDEVSLERQGLQAILRKINGKQVLNFFTDEGLLPNYAFPESGVTLRSVIYRKKAQTSEDGKSFENEVFEYERAASSAISELAPENTFYAGGRKISIEQVDLKLSNIEKWRFCPSCNHSKEDIGEPNPVCPRCHDPMWSDAGQSVSMVRLRQVMANTSDRDSRIGDDSDDREPVFYTKQLLPDFSPEYVESAYKLDSKTFPFGFEFIRKVDFREVNFGKFSANHEETLIGGESLARPGFKLCQYCGMVHKTKKNDRKHSFVCPGKDKDDDENFIDCLYLYREFTSEALRILLPIYTTEGAERYLNSFIAALQLGLKKKFGGKVDHLRAMTYSTPIPDSDIRQHFLMLYDSVPGGTGYLQNLMDKPIELMELFRLARDVMATCECNHTENDGCYHCLYAYRNSHGMESTSRSLAVELFSNILDLEDKIVAIEKVDDIAVNPVMDSELEARFIEAIRRFGLNQSWDVQIHPQVILGKPGYYLRVGRGDSDREYLIEPQKMLSESEGVNISSKPDFMISSSRDDGFLPIAIFMDGFKWHKSTVTEDTLKRLSIVESGHYYQWSLTWADVNQQFAKSQINSRNPFNEIQNEQLGSAKKKLTAELGIASIRGVPLKSPLEQLMLYLQDPDPVQWQKMVFVHGLGWFDKKMKSTETVSAVINRFKKVAPSSRVNDFEQVSEQAFYGGLSYKGDDLLTILCKLPELSIKELNPELANFNVILNNQSDLESEDYKAAWHGFLRVYNLFQFMPASGFFTAEGGEIGVYETLNWRSSIYVPSVDKKASVDDEITESLLEDALEEFHDSLHKLVKKQLPLPEISYELQDGVGEIIAEAEFYWDSLKVVGLLESQVEYSNLFKQSGWQVIELDDNAKWLIIFEKLVNQIGPKDK